MIQCVGNGRSRCVNHDLTDGFCTKRSAFLVAGFKFNLNISDIRARGDFVLQEGIFRNFSPFIIGNVFIKRHPDALQKSSLRLHPRQRRIERGSAVNGGVVVNYLRLSGLQIRFHLSHGGHVRRRRDF